MSVFSKPVRQPEPHLQTTEFFSNADHPIIFGGNFTSVNNTTAKSAGKGGFVILQEHVARAAFHNSKQRADPPRCHPGTRQAVLEELLDWIVGDQLREGSADDQSRAREAWIAWLNGAAGAGKSAICQSLAEICIEQDIKVASFFFFRTDSTRNTIDPVVATLAYQVIQLYPQTKEFIVHSIETHPLIFEQTFATQLEELIVAPLRRLQTFDMGARLLLLLDGVDECTSPGAQGDLIRTCSRLLQDKDLPLLVLFGSRREATIQMAFNTQEIHGILKQMPLDNDFNAPEDIELFLVERFNTIKSSHPLRRHLTPDWPPTEHVRQIVNKSSMQFIYAAVVVTFVAMPSANPSTQLEIVRGLRPAGRATPFAELDALYRHIFSEVDDIEIVLRFLAYRIVSWYPSMRKVFYFFDIAEGDAESVLAPLTSVLRYDAEMDSIFLKHASLTDFLQDKERSQDFYISTHAWGTELSFLWFKNATSGRFKHFSKYKQNTDLHNFLEYAKPTPDLYSLILDYSPLQTPTGYAWSSFSEAIVKFLSKNDFGDDGELHRSKYDQIFQFVQSEYPEHQDGVKKYAPKAFDRQVNEKTPQNTDNSPPPKRSMRTKIKTWLKR